jgi:hypothetical protein
MEDEKLGRYCLSYTFSCLKTETGKKYTLTNNITRTRAVVSRINMPDSGCLVKNLLQR